jgi:hypothetical protein
LTNSITLLLGSGLGLFIPPVISLLYAASASTSNTATLSVPLPAVARAIYGTNLAIIGSSILFFFQAGSSAGLEEGEMAMLDYYLDKDIVQKIDSVSGVVADVFPMLVSLPLVFLGLQGIQRPKNTEKATIYLKENYIASEVAYGFERTWA